MTQDLPQPPLHATPPGRLFWLTLLALVWALYGLTGRDSWQADEALTLGEALGWLHMDATPLQAPLYAWLAGLAIDLLAGVLDPQAAARLPSALFALVGLLCTGLAARRLYGPGYGLLAVLLLMGAFGLILRVHALLPETALLAGQALLLYGLAASRERARHAWALVAAVMLLLLTRGLADLTAALLLAALTPWLPGFATHGLRRALMVASLLALVLTVAWLSHLAAQGLASDWWALQLDRLADARTPQRLLATLAWFAWPAWPLALWALWHEHRRLARAHPLHLPLLATAVGLPLGLVPAYTHDGMAIPLLVPLTLLATFGIATLRRGAAQAFYWFGVCCFAFFTLAFWLHYSALEWGWPQVLSTHLHRMTPGYAAALVEADAVALALAATVLWFVAVPLFPRAQARPALVWATGMTLAWVLLMTLLRPWAELSWGYRPVIMALARQLPPRACVTIEAPAAARVMLAYHLADRLPRAGERCDWRVEVVRREAAPRADAQLVWEGRRPREKRESYRLYRLHAYDAP
ncbi:MAG: glycosyltransferase family 39 protein [Thiobacillaceae bacterium]|nr:glycosyltransferase family 39 protein [Thiobacillaceae bacterium]